jgi:hypothetical protein
MSKKVLAPAWHGPSIKTIPVRKVWKTVPLQQKLQTTCCKVQQSISRSFMIFLILSTGLEVISGLYLVQVWKWSQDIYLVQVWKWSQDIYFTVLRCFISCFILMVISGHLLYCFTLFYFLFILMVISGYLLYCFTLFYFLFHTDGDLRTFTLLFYLVLFLVSYWWWSQDIYFTVLPCFISCFILMVISGHLLYCFTLFYFLFHTDGDLRLLYCLFLQCSLLKLLCLFFFSSQIVSAMKVFFLVLLRYDKISVFLFILSFILTHNTDYYKLDFYILYVYT